MSKFCPKCGKTIEKGRFCLECNPETIEHKHIKIKLCPSKSVFIQGKWSEFEDLRQLSERLLTKFVKQSVKLIRGLEFYENLLEKSGMKKKLEMIVDFQDQEYMIPVEVEITYSPKYAKLGSTYFEGILQLRNTRPDVREYIQKYMLKNNVMLNREIHKPKESDYYFINKRKMHPLAQKIIRNFGGEVDANAQLFSYNNQTSKDIFRVNVLVMIPDFQERDVIEYQDKTLLITGFGKIITTLNLETNKKFTFQFKFKEKYVLLTKMKTTITKVRPELEVLHPKTYQSVICKNPLNIEVSAERNVVIVENKKHVFLTK